MIAVAKSERRFGPTLPDTDDDTVGFAIRLPYTVPSSGGHGTGMSSRCRGPTRPPAFQATVVPRNRSGGS